jgi:hypothetical protein
LPSQASGLGDLRNLRGSLSQHVAHGVELASLILRHHITAEALGIVEVQKVTSDIILAMVLQRSGSGRGRPALGPGVTG